MQKIKRLIPNLFTAGNLIGGILAILLTLTGNIYLAPFCIFASAILDFLDGFMARLLKVPSEMGKQLDSLADMVTFGVAPGIIMLTMLTAPDIAYLGSVIPDSPTTEFIAYAQDNSFPELMKTSIETEDGSYFISTARKYGGPAYPFSLFGLLGLIIPVFALFRLAKFNIDTRQSDSFIGLPTPAMTLFFAVMPLLFHETYLELMSSEIHYESWKYLAAKFLANPWVLLSFTVIFSVLMVAEIPLFALKFKHFKWKGNEIRFIFLLLTVVLLATLFLWAIPLVIILYVILSLISKSEIKTDEIQSGN